MLVLSRKKNESIIINDNITVTVIEIRGDKVRLGIEAPKDVTVHRREVYEAIQNQNPTTLDPGSKVPASGSVIELGASRSIRLTNDLVQQCTSLVSFPLDDVPEHGSVSITLGAGIDCRSHQPDEFPHPGSVVRPTSDRDERAVDDHVSIHELARPPRGRRARDPDSGHGLSLGRAGRQDEQGTVAVGGDRLARLQEVAHDRQRPSARFLKYSGARPPGRTRP